MLFSYHLYFAALALVPYALAVLMPSWRWLLGSFIITSSLFVLGISWLSKVPGPSFEAGEGIVYAMFVGYIAAIIFLWGVTLRAVTLLLRWRTAATLSVHAAGFLLAIAVPIMGPQFLDWWQQRAPGEACRSATFDVAVEGLHFAIPAAPLFSIYAGAGPSDPRFSLTQASGRREFCATYDDGRIPVKAVNLSIGFLSFPGPKEFCNNAPVWARPVCAGAPTTRHPDSEFPLQAQVFSASATAAVGPLSTETESGAPLKGARNVVVRSDVTTADGKPLSFACSITPGQEEDVAYCRAAYAWRDGAYITYTFFAPTTLIEERGRRYDAAVHALFESLLKP